MNEDGNISPPAALSTASILRATTKRTGTSSEQQKSPSLLGKRARSSGNSLSGNDNLQGGKRNAITLSHAVGHSHDGGRGTVATHPPGRARSATTNAAASNSTKNNANVNAKSNANQWFDVGGKRFIVLIEDNGKSLRKVSHMLTVDGKKPDGKILAMGQLLSKLFRKHHGQTDSLETAPLTQENEAGGGIYHWTGNGNSTIGETDCYLVRGKYRLKSEGQLLEDVPATKQVRARMSVVYTTKQCVAIMMSEPFRPILDTIVKMKLPRLCFHRSKMDELIKKISRVCIELCVASIDNGFNNTVFEDIITKLSDEIEELFKLPDPDKDCSRVINKTLRYYRIYTWCHGGSWLLHLKTSDNPSLPDGRSFSLQQREFLQAVIRKTHPHLFLHNNLYNEIFGNSPLVAPFVDAVEGKDNPLVTLWFKVIDELIELYTPSIMESFLQTGEIPIQVAEKAEQIVSQLHGVPDYFSPSEDELVEAYNHRVREVHNKCKDEENAMITMEYEVFNRLSEETKAIIFPPGTKHYIQPNIDENEAERVFETPYGPDVRVMFSFHVTLGHNKTIAHRVQCWKRTLATMVLNNKAKLLSDAELQHQMGVYKCFFMRLVGLDGSLSEPKGSLNDALKGALAEGLCNPHFGRQGTQMTANAIGNGISQKSVICLRCFLGRDIFNALLTSCGRPTSQANPSPLDDPSRSQVWEEANQRDCQRAHGITKYGWGTAYPDLATHQQANREEKREKIRKYRQEHREELRESDRAKYQTKREKEGFKACLLRDGTKAFFKPSAQRITAEQVNREDQPYYEQDWFKKYFGNRLVSALKAYNSDEVKGNLTSSYIFLEHLKALYENIRMVEDIQKARINNRQSLLESLGKCSKKEDLNLYFNNEVILTIPPGTKLGLTIRKDNNKLGGVVITNVQDACTFKDIVGIGWRITSIDNVPVKSKDDFKAKDSNRHRVMRFVRPPSSSSTEIRKYIPIPTICCA